MWWTIGIIAIIAAVVITIAICVVIIVVCLNASPARGDYGDGGGTQVGGTEDVPFFIPANERAGMQGEKRVNYHLRPLLQKDEYLLANVLLPLKNGFKAEIDCILISRKGIFCVETKNWVGHVRGNDEDEYWVQKYDDPYKRDKEHKNPIKQNEAHCAILERKLNNKYYVENIVIFVELENVFGLDSEHAFTIMQFKEYYRMKNTNIVPETSLATIYQTLMPYVASPEELVKHREEIRKRFNND